MRLGDLMKLIKNDVYRLPILFVGFIVMSIGITLIKRSDLGLFAWGVFHDGLSLVTPYSFGEITRNLGFVILLFSMIAFKTKFGPGTILNIVIVGWMIDYSNELIVFIPTSLFHQIILFTIGLFLMTVGKAYYISSKLGAGPRDGLFVGVSRITKVDVKYVKPGIEVIVLLIGFLLGGVAGVGTIVAMISSGYLIQYFFTLFHFNPKEEHQRGFYDYIIAFKNERDQI